MPETSLPNVLRTITIMPSISIALVALRLYSRYLTKRFLLDDFFIIVALVLAIAYSVSGWAYAKLNMVGFDRADFELLTGEELSVVGKWDLVTQVLYNPILTFVRASIIAFILSLAQLPKAIRVNLIAINFVNWALFFSALFSVLFQCHPFHYTYDWKLMDEAAREAAGAGPDGTLDGRLVAGGSCIGRAAVYLATAIIDICIDLWLLAIPSALVWKLNMTKKQKAIVVIVMSAWVVATILIIIRVALLAPYWLTRTGTGRHFGYHFGFVFPFGHIQVNVAIWTASVPAYKTLVSRVLPWLWPTAATHTSTTDRNGVELEGMMPSAQPDGPYRPRSVAGAFPAVRPLPRAGRGNLSRSEADIRRFEHDVGLTSLGEAGYYTPENDTRSSTISPGTT